MTVYREMKVIMCRNTTILYVSSSQALLLYTSKPCRKQVDLQDEAKQTDRAALILIIIVMFNRKEELIIEGDINTSAIHPPNTPLMLYGA